MVINSLDYVSDGGQSYYGGSFLIGVSDASDRLGSASGRFTLGFDLDTDTTFIVLPTSPFDIVSPQSVPLVVDVRTDAPGPMGACCWWNLSCVETLASACASPNGPWRRGWSCEAPEWECTIRTPRFPSNPD